MNTIALTAPIMQLVNGACQDAITTALHDAAPLKFHKRYGIGADCQLCNSAVEETYDAIRSGHHHTPLGDQISKALVEAPASPALQAYLEEHELVPDAPAPYEERDQEIEDRITYQDMTAKELRTLASAAGMKGARVAKKAELVEYLTHQGCGCTGK